MEDECSRTFLIMVVKLVVPIMISLTVAVNASNALPNDPPIIEIGDGKLMGSFQHSVSGKLHSAFLGIPFAQPPVSIAEVDSTLVIYCFSKYFSWFDELKRALPILWAFHLLSASGKVQPLSMPIPRIPSRVKWYLSYGNQHSFVKGIKPYIYLEPNTSSNTYSWHDIKEEPWNFQRLVPWDFARLSRMNHGMVFATQPTVIIGAYKYGFPDWLAMKIVCTSTFIHPTQISLWLHQIYQSW